MVSATPLTRARLLVFLLAAAGLALLRPSPSLLAWGVDGPQLSLRPTRRLVEPKNNKHRRNTNCQVVVLLGVEGASNHGLVPVIERLAEIQTDGNGAPYELADPNDPEVFRAVWGTDGEFLPMDDERSVTTFLKTICPMDGKKHVLLLPTTFPGDGEGADDPDPWRLYDGLASRVDLKFVAMHRPFLETVASHPSFDGGVEAHSNVVGKYLLLFRRFLETHTYDPFAGGARPWALLCLEHLSADYHDRVWIKQLQARRAAVRNLAKFLGWPMVAECEGCFDEWEDGRDDPAVSRLKKWGTGEPETLAAAEKARRRLEGKWPPDLKGEEISLSVSLSRLY